MLLVSKVPVVKPAVPCLRAVSTKPVKIGRNLLHRLYPPGLLDPGLGLTLATNHEAVINFRNLSPIEMLQGALILDEFSTWGL